MSWEGGAGGRRRGQRALLAVPAIQREPQPGLSGPLPSLDPLDPEEGLKVLEADLWGWPLRGLSRLHRS